MIYIRYNLLNYFAFFVSEIRFLVKSLLAVITFAILACIIYIFNCITFLIQFLRWIRTLCCWNNLCRGEGKSSFLFIPIPPFRIPRVNTTMHYYTINIYCYLHHYFTVCSLQVIRFIVLSIQSIISINGEIKTVVYL